MDALEAIRQRHSVRMYEKKDLSPDTTAVLKEWIAHCNQEGKLEMQLITNEPKTFGESILAHYGKFSNVSTYILLCGKDASDLEQRCGYYGEKVVIRAQELGLNTCWVAGSYSKRQARTYVQTGEKLIGVIAIGYGAGKGKPHKSKTFEQVTDITGEIPAWFRTGVESALLAPTAMNQQKFCFILHNGNVSVKAMRGPCSKIDLGIVQYHFEIGANQKVVAL